MDTKNEDKYEDGEVSMGGAQPSDPKQTVSVRNLRIREDTAKYLRNLDADSAYYDPKTRSMRENPYEGTGKARFYMLFVDIETFQVEAIFATFLLFFVKTYKRTRKMYHLLVKTLFDILESPKSSPSPKFLPGTLWIRVLTFTRRQIQPNWPFCERVTKQKRYFLFTLLYG